MELVRGVTEISQEMVAGVVEAAEETRFAVFVISTQDDAGREGIFKAVRHSLPLDPPLRSCRSWDALSDSLWEGLRLLRSDSILIVWPDAQRYQSASPADYDMIISIFREVANSIADPIATNGFPKMVGIYVASR